jgi:ligand-binding sensor domain-containing protein
VEDGLSNNQVITIQEDQNGNIWFATDEGISSYDGKKITIQVSLSDLNSIKKIKSEWKNEPHDLWFNVEINKNHPGKKGLYRYDNHHLSFLAIPDQVLDQGICKNTGAITGIAKGKDNQIWFANYEGVFGYDRKSFQLFKDKEILYHVRSIFEDSKGNLWIGNNGIGVLLFDGETMINFTKKYEVSNPDYFKTKQVSNRPGLLARVFSIGEDKNGNIWFGTIDAGAWKFDGKELTNYTKKDGLTSMEIMEIYLDKQGVLWFGMGDGSVCQFNGKSFEKIY